MDTFALLSRSTKLRKPVGVPPAAEAVKQATEGQDRATRKRKRNHESSVDSADVFRAPVSASNSLSEDECRQIMKSHKLKATFLWRAEDYSSLPADRKAKKRRPKPESEAAASMKKRKVEVVPQPLTAFLQLRSRYQLPDSLLLNLDAQGFRSPTQVQIGSLPLLLDTGAGHLPSGASRDTLPACNLMAVAPTGSGKTLAFLIPMVASIIRRRRDAQEDAPAGPLAVIVAPTKELARQIVNESRKLCAKTGIRTTLVRRGVTLYGSAVRDEAKDRDEDSSSDDPDSSSRPAATLVKSQILVATPMAMVHAATPPNGQRATLPTVQNLVLDEADVLLDPLFREQTTQIWKACSSSSLRVSLWSATVGSSIEELATTMLKESFGKTGSSKGRPRPFVRLVVGLKDSSIPNIDHRLVYAASEQGKLMGMRQLLRAPGTSKDGTTLRPPFLVFTQTIPRATALHSELLYDIPPEAGGSSRIAVLHSDLSETARDGVMARLRKGEIWVLITTDLLARGIDFAGINGVVNYDLPTSSAAYVHRAGRTGRAGREGGVAVTLYSKDDLPFVKNIANVIAASERVKGGDEAAAAQRKWLLESLPKVTKKDKQQLKRRGVESRRAAPVKEDDNRSKRDKSQISTKGGFLRRVENNRKGAIEGSRRRAAAAAVAATEAEVEFEGDSDDGASSSEA